MSSDSRQSWISSLMTEPVSRMAAESLTGPLMTISLRRAAARRATSPADSSARATAVPDSGGTAACHAAISRPAAAPRTALNNWRAVD